MVAPSEISRRRGEEDPSPCSRNSASAFSPRSSPLRPFPSVPFRHPLPTRPSSAAISTKPLTVARAERRTLFVEPDGPGFLRLTVIDARGAADSVVVRLQ